MLIIIYMALVLAATLCAAGQRRGLLRWLRSLFAPRPARLAIVRRYCDANGSYVGELYLEGEFAGVSAYRMVGVSLDTLPLDIKTSELFDLDTRRDFLAPMTRHCVRVGAIDPRENDAVRAMVAKLPRHGMRLDIRNGFIEHILEKARP